MQRLVLVSGAGQRFAVPLEQVSRLEEFPATAIERTGSRRVVQYRGRILPLVDVPALLDNRSPPDTAPPPAVQVVVCGGGERSVGLVVERILDVVAAPLNVRTAAGRPNVLFTTVVDRQVTEVLDVDAIMQACA